MPSVFDIHYSTAAQPRQPRIVGCHNCGRKIDVSEVPPNISCWWLCAKCIEKSQKKDKYAKL